MARHVAALTRRQLLHRAVVTSAALIACRPQTNVIPSSVASTGASGASAAAVSGEPTENTSAALAVVRQATVGLMAEAAALVALERGYFAAEGLAVEIVDARATDQILLGLTSGEISLCPAPLSPALLNALARGVPLKLVAPLGTNRAGASAVFLMVRAALFEHGEITEYPDLLGRRLGKPPNSVPGAYVLETALSNGGVPLGRVDVVELEGAEAVPALANGAVDVAIVAEPGATIAEDLHAAVKWKSYGDVRPGLQAGAIVFGPALAAAQAEVGRRWMVAYARGVREYTRLLEQSGGRHELGVLLAPHLPVRGIELYERMSYVDLDPSLQMNEPSLTALLAWSKAQGLVTGSVDLTHAIDMSYVQYALGRLGPVS